MSTRSECCVMRLRTTLHPKHEDPSNGWGKWQRVEYDMYDSSAIYASPLNKTLTAFETMHMQGRILTRDSQIPEWDTELRVIRDAFFAPHLVLAA